MGVKTTKLCIIVESIFFSHRGEYSHGAAKEIITTVYTAVPEVHYIYLLVPKSAYPGRFT